MTLEQIFWVAAAVLTLVGLPLGMAFGVWQHVRTAKHRNSRPRGERSHVSVGNALQELDRLVARSAIEFTIEAERPILKREDDRGCD